MDVISVPKDIGGKLPLIAGTTEAELSRLSMGKSQSGQPKVTLEFTVTEEIAGPDDESTIGAKVLETCSLQPQALWKLNDYYKAVKGEDIPEGNHSAEEFENLMNEALLGTRWSLDLVVEKDNKDNDRTQVAKAAFAG